MDIDDRNSNLLITFAGNGTVVIINKGTDERIGLDMAQFQRVMTIGDMYLNPKY